MEDYRNYVCDVEFEGKTKILRCIGQNFYVQKLYFEVPEHLKAQLGETFEVEEWQVTKLHKHGNITIDNTETLRKIFE